MEKVELVQQEMILNNIVKTFGDYIIDNNLKSVVLGVSGGIDSALVAAIAYETKKYLRMLNSEVKIIGFYLPIESNKQDEEDRAVAIGDAFIHLFEINMNPVKNYENFAGKIFHEGVNNYTKSEKIYNGNIKARLRMIELYSQAYLNEGMVLSTDNLTEYYLGFWTLHGDVGDYGPIQQLWKMEVYQLSEYLVKKYEAENNFEKAKALQDCIEAVPTDGLGITNSDLDQLGVDTYAEVDRILRRRVECNIIENSPIIDRYNKSKYKRENPISIYRKVIFGKEKL